MANRSLEYPAKKAIKSMNVEMKVVGIKRMVIRLKIASWLVKLACKIGNFRYVSVDKDE